MTALTYWTIEWDGPSADPSVPYMAGPFRTKDEAATFAVECGITLDLVAPRHAFGEEASKMLAKLAEIEAMEQGLDEAIEGL